MIESKVNKELERKIDLYVNGKLNADETDELWAELIQDEYYLDYMKSVANLKAVIDKKKQAQPSAKIYSLPKVMRYAAAAAVILIAGVIGVMNYNTTENLSVGPIDQIGLDVVRSADGFSETVESEVIREAIKLATDGEVNEAVQLLQNEMETTNDTQLKAELALSLGSIQYNNGQYQESIESFELVITQNKIDVLTLEKGYWFLGNSYFQMDRLEEAEEAFKNAYALNGAYSRVAKTYVDALSTVGR
ncbi:tetratricopeptide repeat protein [Gracilimonas amylolytica]|uniref:tetratricopeptide repeat protein n=1 Tax=Gracilimonas amylolytica TaxID=1749045 RepID=UPI000CD95E64|nr:tetratricopeptide repeat protein [Gracilimonas amylolytica]